MTIQMNKYNKNKPNNLVTVQNTKILRPQQNQTNTEHVHYARYSDK